MIDVTEPRVGERVRSLAAPWVPALPVQQGGTGARCYLGVADVEAGMNGAPRTPDFAADERAIGHGVRAMAGLLTDRLVAGSG